MAGVEFKVGDRIRLTKSVYGGSEAGDVGTVTKLASGGDVFAKLDGRSGGALGNGVYWVDPAAAELAEPDIAIGDTVLVAYEGVVSYVGDGPYYEVEALPGVHHYAGAEHVTLVSKAEPAEPVYTPGKLYRDAGGHLYYRTDNHTWRFLAGNGRATVAEHPYLPMVEVTAQ